MQIYINGKQSPFTHLPAFTLHHLSNSVTFPQQYRNPNLHRPRTHLLKHLQANQHNPSTLQKPSTHNQNLKLPNIRRPSIYKQKQRHNLNILTK